MSINKFIVKFNKTNLDGVIVLDNFNSYLEEDLPIIFNNINPAKIVVKNFWKVPANIVSKLTLHYLHGAEIEFVCKKNDRLFNKTYKLAHPVNMYSYKFEQLDFTKPIPKSLAEFKFKYRGKETTYLNAIKSLSNINYLPNEIWTAIDTYSQSMIDKCKKHNAGNYTFAESWYKQACIDFIKAGLAFESPNKKTYLESVAEVQFEKDCEFFKLKQGLRSLNTKELEFLRKYAPAYGIQIPTFKWRYNSHKTKDGYTEEPEVMYSDMSTNEWARVIYDARNHNNLPRFVRAGLKTNEVDNKKMLRESYFNLIWIMKHMKDEGLMPGWKRCPVCHKIYREHDGCECGACEPIELIPADNMFYGDSSSYEDYESTKDFYILEED